MGKRREFRFAWNGEIFSRKDTRMLLMTIAAAILGIILTLIALFISVPAD